MQTSKPLIIPTFVYSSVTRAQLCGKLFQKDRETIENGSYGRQETCRKNGFAVLITSVNACVRIVFICAWGGSWVKLVFIG